MGGGGGGRRRRQGCFRLARGGANFFKQLIGKVIIFLGFARGLFCAFANGITFTKEINFKDPGGDDGQPS